MLLHTNPTRERGECLGTRAARRKICEIREPATRRITSLKPCRGRVRLMCDIMRGDIDGPGARLTDEKHKET